MPARQPIVRHIFGRFCLVVSKNFVADGRLSYFSVDNVISYVGFCDDFGPMSLGSIFQFCQIVDSKLTESQSRPIGMITLPDKKRLTNAVFLIGAYMIMKLNMKPNEVELRFDDLNYSLVSYRDVSSGAQNFSLLVKDCWAGLYKARALDWINFGPDGFDMNEYMHFDDPLNADLHEIVPGKFIAMRGPIDLPGNAPFRDIVSTSSMLFNRREFSPSHYVDILHQFHVQLVVRLNAVEYSSQTFIEQGIGFADLPFQDCTTPPVDVVAKFMMIAERVPGCIAVHCKAGLGRTGTLIALYMMRHYGFTAREAMGWIRIVRPGSIIGTQQQFLCDKEDLMQRGFAKFFRDVPTAVTGNTSVDSLCRFVERVKVLVDCRIRNVMARSLSQQLSSGLRTSSTESTAESERNLKQLAEHVSKATDRRSSRLAKERFLREQP